MGSGGSADGDRTTGSPADVESIRDDAADYQTRTPGSWTDPSDRPERELAYREGSFTKLLEHDPETGLLTEEGLEEYANLVAAIEGNDSSQLDAITRANESDDDEGERLWISPRAASAGSIKGAHPSTVGDGFTGTDPGESLGFEFTMDEPPAVDSALGAAELMEAYLFAVCRDVEFDDYGTGERTDDAAAFDAIDDDACEGSITQWAADRLTEVLEEVAKVEAGFDGVGEVAARLEVPTEDGAVTPDTLFRGYSRTETDGPDDLTGPYHSQFFLQQLYPLFPSGCAPYVAQLTGVTELDLDEIAIPRHVPIANRREFGVTWEDFVAVQDGNLPDRYRERDFEQDRGRYAITGRDMGTHVHTDGPYQEYYRATTVLIFWDFPRTSLSPYTPRDDPSDPVSPNEADGVTFGPVDPFSLVGAVSYEAFKAAWAQKWRAFRRLRPEAMAGLVELQENRSEDCPDDVTGVHDLLESDPARDVLGLVAEYNRRQAEMRFVDDSDAADTLLLGQMYPEGSPAHPAYPSGHATMAGAGVTVLKALFDDEAPITETGMRPVGIDPEDPTEHVFIDRGEHADDAVGEMTVGSELDKLASNIAHARMFGGVHFRSDGERGIRLGEQVAIRFLQDHLRSYPEGEFGGGFEFTSRDGHRIRVEAEDVSIVE